MIIEHRRNRIIASPRARRAMRERNIDPRSLRGSGPGGRIVEADVLRAPAGAADPRQTMVSAAPHFVLRATADVTSLVEVQKQIADDVQRVCGAPLKTGDVVLRALALALADCPKANRVWRNETYASADAVGVGLVIEGSAGLASCVLDHSDGVTLLDLVRWRAEAVAAVTSGRLPAQSGAEAAASLCDLTEQAIDDCTAVLLPPQTSILAAGRVAPRPMACGNQLCLRPTLCLSLTADQRAVTPQTAAALLGRIVELLEQPFLLLCERLRL
jgi:pyruvate dehydrogenase E2 component (dihydrolipoamide acetyltransferase)